MSPRQQMQALADQEALTMKTLALAAILALGSLGAGSAQEVVRVATEGAFPPFNFVNDAGGLRHRPRPGALRARGARLHVGAERLGLDHPELGLGQL